MTGGDLVAEVLVKRGVEFVFTLCGGHISPILIRSRERGIRVVDVRDEASAAFAADALSRLTGTPGVAVVTAGPGLTNTLTAVKNAQLAQSPLVVLGGAAATLLRDRGALQDIDQVALLEPHVKWLATVDRVRDLVPAVEEAFEEARLGVPGPVFVECPVDLLYEETLVRGVYGVGDERPESVRDRLVRWHLERHLRRLFAGSRKVKTSEPPQVPPVRAGRRTVRQVASELRRAERPLVLIGSQALIGGPAVADEIAAAVDRLGVPVYLSGLARGLLGREHRRHFRHRRRAALKEADWVLLAGVPCDFRLDYGRSIPRRTRLVAVNLSDHDLALNRRPQRAIVAHPGFFLAALAAEGDPAESAWQGWLDLLAQRDEERGEEIAAEARRETEYVNPLRLCLEIDRAAGEDAVVVADGGDFVATASYTVRPRGPLRWLDPGPFGTLGVGGGFALAAKLVHPEAEVWLLYGDGAAAYSLAELDTCVRHRLPVIAVVGNDGGWTQVAREQVAVFGDDCATALRRSDYDRVARGYGAEGLRVEREDQLPEALAEARRIARSGRPVVVNVLIGKTDFRKGSISM